MPHAGGRPTDYSPELAETICDRLIAGDSLRKICESEEMPAKVTILRWLVKHEQFRAQYAIARELQAEGELDEMKDISDDDAADVVFKEVETAHGSEAKAVFMRANVDRAKLRIETRRLRMEKMAPRKYGPLLKQEISGPDGSPVSMRNVSDAELDNRLTQLLGKAGVNPAPGRDEPASAGE